MSTRNRPLSVPVLPAPSFRTSSKPGRAAARVGLTLGLSLGLGLAVGCDESPAPRQELPPPVRPSLNADAAAPRPSPEEAAALVLTGLENELVSKHGEAQRARIKRGLKQVAALWHRGDEGSAPDPKDRGGKDRGDKGDGDLAAFVRAQFISDPVVLAATFQRLEGALEQLDGGVLRQPEFVPRCGALCFAHRGQDSPHGPGGLRSSRPLSRSILVGVPDPVQR